MRLLVGMILITAAAFAIVYYQSTQEDQYVQQIIKEHGNVQRTRSHGRGNFSR